jgi:hypothetical protein
MDISVLPGRRARQLLFMSGAASKVVRVPVGWEWERRGETRQSFFID